jgi:hypothetical protein
MMNKTIWMCWLQGEDSSSMPLLNRECVKRWRDFNSDWNVKVLSYDNIANYAPEFFDIKAKNEKPHPFQRQADLLRKQLLSRYGGVWADASLYPTMPLSAFYDKIVNETNFFAYRFSPRRKCIKGAREIVNWFLVARESHNYLIDKWLEKYINFYTTHGADEWECHFQDHMILCDLYDSDSEVKYIIDNMVQIDEKIPHSLNSTSYKHGSLKGMEHRIAEYARNPKELSFLYKRPDLL